MRDVPVLELHALTKRYRRTVAVRELSVTIPAGGITALLGPNGAGKSTLLKMCIGFERPTSGTIRVLGIDPVRRRGDALAKLGYVPQAPALYRDMPVDDHLRLCRALRPAFDIAHARDRLVALGISPNAKAGHLSGGEQAQVTLAIALGTRAPVLLLDEPLASLDPLARREFLEVASDAAKGGDVSIVLSSHVISEIEGVADRLLVLGEGRVLFEDTVAASLGNHRILDVGAHIDGLDVVARFPGQGNARHLLVRLTSLRASMRPLRTELLGVAGVTALLLLAAAGVAARLLAFDLPAACFDSTSIDVVCNGRQYDLDAYASFARDWGAMVGIFAIALPAIAGAILGIAAIAKELDQRTAVLAWSVDSSRRHWLLQRTLPLLGVIVVLGLLSTQIIEAMLWLQHPEADLAAALGFDAIPYSGIGPMATGISAFGVALVIGAMLGRLLPALLAVAALVILVNVLVTQGNERLMANESLVAEYSRVGAGRPIDTMLRTPDGRIVSFDEGFAQYGDPETGELPPDVTQMARYVPIEIYPQVAARYALFHMLIGLAALTLAFAVVERRSPS